MILEWSREMLLEKWMVDPVVCFESMGLQTPFLALRQKNFDIPSALEYLQVFNLYVDTLYAHH